MREDSCLFVSLFFALLWTLLVHEPTVCQTLGWPNPALPSEAYFASGAPQFPPAEPSALAYAARPWEGPAEVPGHFPGIPPEMYFGSYAATYPPAGGQLPIDPSAERLRLIETRLSALERQQASASPQPSAKDVSAEKFTVRPSAVVQADYVNFPAQDAASSAVYGDINDYFSFRRLFLGLEGTGYGVWEYRFIVNVEPKQIIRDLNGNRLAETDVVQLRDCWIAHRDMPLLGRVSLGNMKVPYSLEELTSSRFISLMERAAPSDVFSPKRHVGIMASNQSPSQVFGWSTGVFFACVSQELKERISDEQGVIWALRGWSSPVYVADGRGVLHVGAAYVYTSDDDGRVRFAVRPEAWEAPLALDTGAFLAEHIHRLGLETAIVAGPFSIQSELFGVSTTGDPTWGERNFYGAYVLGSYFLTGECRSYDRPRGVFHRITPYTNFWWVKTADGHSFGWGAWELVARWSWVDLSEPGLTSPLAGQMHNMTFGVNWYWNPHMKMMFQWIHSFSDVPGATQVAQTDILGLSWRADF